MSIFADMVRWRAGGHQGLITFPRKLVVQMINSFAGPDLLKLNFDHDGSGRWVRRRKEPIREVVELWTPNIKTNLIMGVALPFVPDIRGTRTVLLKAPERNGFLIQVPGFDRDDYPDDFSSVQPSPDLLAEDILKRVPA